MRIIAFTEECFKYDCLQQQTIKTSQLLGLTPVSDTNIKTEEMYLLGHNTMLSVESQRMFRRIFRLHLQGRRTGQARNQ
jgi:hypothetical protein